MNHSIVEQSLRETRLSMNDERIDARTGRLESWLVVGVLVLLAWLPVPLGSNRPWAVGILVFSVFMMTALWSINLLIRPMTRSQRQGLKLGMPLLGLLIAAQVWVGLQWFDGLSLHSGASLTSLLLGCAYALLFLLVIGVFHTRRRLMLLLGLLVVSGTLQAFYGAMSVLAGSDAWMLLGIDGAGHSHSATGTFTNRNHLAGYLELTIAAGIGLLLALRDGQPFAWKSFAELLIGPKARLRLALVVMVIGLVTTASRGGNSGFFIALLVIGMLFVLRFPQNRRRNMLILTSIIIIDLVIISQYFGLERLRDRLVNTEVTVLFERDAADGEVADRAETDGTGILTDPRVSDDPDAIPFAEHSRDSSDNGLHMTGLMALQGFAAGDVERFVSGVDVFGSDRQDWRLTVDVNDMRGMIFHQAVPLIETLPWQGYGAGAFETTFMALGDPGFRGRVDHAHNDYIQFWVEYGAIGSTPLALFVLISLTLALKALWNRESFFRSGVGFGASMGLLAILIHSWTDYNLQIPANAATFVVICAVAVLASTHASNRRHTQREFTRSVWGR